MTGQSPDTDSRAARAETTKRRLLDATVEVLVERGYGGASTIEVTQRAGLSRGALLHHYASRTDLMVAAIEHLTRQRIAEFPLVSSQAPDNDRVRWAVTILWQSFRGPLYVATLELWLAARNDPDLLAVLLPQERIMGQFIRGMAADLFGAGVSQRPGFAIALEVLLDSQRGAAARSVLRSNDTDDRLIDAWVALVQSFIEGAAPKR